MDDVVLCADGVRYWIRTWSYSVQGDRQYQEDEILFDSDEHFLYFGVFDGHGGRQASSFAKEHLVANIKAQDGILDEDASLAIDAIKAGFADTQKAMEFAADDWPKTSSGHRSTAGTTVSLVLIDRRRSRMFVAHLGDSRVLLGRGVAAENLRSEDPSDVEQDRDEMWAASPLTIDHKPESEVERERIWRHGGSIMVKYNVPRVVWRRKNRYTEVFEQVPFLAIARSLGDLWSYNYDSGEYIVSPVPDVECIPISTDLRCLVLGSDGLFNMLSNSEVVGKVQEAAVGGSIKATVSLQRSLTPAKVEEYLSQVEQFNLRASRDPSGELVKMALERWKRTQLRSDNISVLTVAFRYLARELRPEKEVLVQSETEKISESVASSPEPAKNNGLTHTPPPSDEETSLLRLPLNHLNHNRTCGAKRSRSLDSACTKHPRLHHMDLRGARDRACKRASRVSSGVITPAHAGATSGV
ncbi:protein phosphatase 1D-like [Tropilaelaps mercedesae]|uniref:Protein phosphatase 1D-like n=1 Tax=Tropilaelaps mercedesae TaxID=418985 RepID=A0A1V9XKL0_9ACAR|nr:protein phosphatase 1D-like [Tropilaelaps mercedesae]